MKTEPRRRLESMLPKLSLVMLLPPRAELHAYKVGNSKMQSWCLSALLLLALAVLEGLAAASPEQHGADESRCPSCGMPALDKGSEEQLLTEIAKQQILSKLHLKERPNITHAVPRAALVTALRKLHAGRVRQDGTLELGNTPESAQTRDPAYEIVSFADTDHADSAPGRGGLAFQFSKERGQSLQILQSTLWLYVRAAEAPRGKATAQVYAAGPGGANRTLLGQKQFEVKWGRWHTFTVTRGVQAFFDSGDKRLRLELECQGCQELAVLGSPGNSSHQPFLVAQVRPRDESHAIRRRSLSCGSNVSLCCKKDFYIKFRDIQWQDWIIAPEGYHMNYCMGQCPQHLAGAPGIASSFHATVFNQLKANGIHTAINSCCVPIQRRPLSIVYFDSTHSIVKTDIPDMIVESCGCT
ncbi:inhibin beta B chain [Lepisosteus oculatus]|uniref:inhibin beta B chain n=1 Tax=Lepisosteus oculatus TaxID=7918 RepID=UPI0035F51C96